jgi:hypothetical protein
MRRAIALLTFVLALLCGCSGSVLPAPGQIMLVLATDMTPGRDFDTLVVRVADPSLSDEIFYDWRFRAAGGGRFEGDVQLPSTVAVVRRSQGTGAVTTIRVQASLGGVPRVVREARVVIPSSGVQMLRMSLDWLCWDMMPSGTTGAANGLTCPEGASCDGGACTASDSNAESLSAWDPAMVFGSSAGATSGSASPSNRGEACFQVLGCFQGGFTVTPILDRRGTCSFPFSGSADRLNVAVALPPSPPRGFCAGDACVVPLDQGGASGWRLEEGRVVVPRRVCTDGRTLAFSTSCDAKTAAKAPCAEWSSVGVTPAANSDVFTLGLRPAGGT